MYFDIVEAIRAKQRKEQPGIRIENGEVVVRPDEFEPPEIEPPDDLGA